MRSLGIPITVDEYITSPSYSGKHFWTAIIDTTQKAVPFIYNEKEISRSHFDERDKGKVYRTFFGYQPENIVGIYKDKNVPALFKNPFYKDVSKDYFTNEIEIEIQNDRNEKYVYLSIFRQKRWQPIDIAKADRESTVFFNIEENLIYCPVFYEAGHYVEAGYPFVLINSKPIYFIPNIDVMSDIDLIRKFPITSTLRRHLASAIGVTIEGANCEDLSDATLLYHVGDTLNTVHNNIYLSENSKFRYITYKAADSRRIELSELWCYSDNANTTIYNSKIIGIPELKGIHRKITNLIIDNDFVSYYMSAIEGEKLVFDLGRSVSVRKISFSPRNDDNFIHIGDSYELFYHGGLKSWISLGKQKALEPQLHYKNVPNDALLWLHNETRGKEEQVFYYKNGIQIFAYDIH